MMGLPVIAAPPGGEQLNAHLVFLLLVSLIVLVAVVDNEDEKVR